MRIALAAMLSVTALCAQSTAPSAVDIKYDKFTLPNGLTVLVHEDRKAPIVAVNIWYHVGSKNEKPGRTGFAHLFEHLMFNGSEHFNQDYFKALEKVGATDLNGTTNEDRTNYFQNVPTSALDMVLWLESDRMGHLLKAITQEKLDEQRGVVQNEKRQFENQPYAVAEELTIKSTYPAAHPYSWSVIGSMDDLSAAKLEDVHEWFKTYYGPQNAVLVLAGDIDTKTAREKVEKYFGAIPAGPPVARHKAWVAQRDASQRQVVEDRVPQARIRKVWNTPEYTNPDSDYLTIVSAALGQGKSSRLYKRLVYTDQTVTNVAVYIDSREIGSQFVIEATARAGESLAKVEKALDEELARFLQTGPDAAELDRIKTQYYAGFVRGIQRIGGFGGKSDILATNVVFAGDPGYYKVKMDRIQKAGIADVKAAANRWLAGGVYNLEIHPFGQYKAAAADADRAKLPEVGLVPALRMPPLQRRTLSNGLKIVLAERHDTPIVNFQLVVDAGFASDQLSMPGTARLAADLLDEGTKTRTSLQISEEMDRLGANLGAGSDIDYTLVTLSSLKANLDPSLALYADVILNPSFPQADFERLRKNLIAAIQREKAEPFSMGLRVLPAFIYGKDHAYGQAFSGSGTEASAAKLTLDGMRKFHETWFRPNNATLLVVGDTTMAEIAPRIEKLFASWKQGPVPKKNLAQVEVKEKPAIYIIDKPGAIQSVIMAGQVAPPRSNPQEIAIETMNTVLGGAFISRLNMNLREDKHWSYGAGSAMPSTKGQRPFLAYAPVQSDKTKESVGEVIKELRGIVRDMPVTEDELTMAVGNQTLRLAGSQETIPALMGDVSDIVRFDLPDDYYLTYAGKVRALKREDLNAAAERVLRPDRMIWVIVGDRAKIEPGIKELNIGPVQAVDPDGNPLP
ncbi:MAG TPA: peptidase M16 [Solibacterales bacterium]|nr:peptidase M16 [Bryobacterales bacterium]